MKQRRRRHRTRVQDVENITADDGVDINEMRSDDKENEEAGDGAKNERCEAVEERAETEQTVKKIKWTTKGTGDRTRNEKTQ